jgi:hypothetical protein
MELIYTESQGRTQRAIYPMKRIPTQFSITAALVGYGEHRAFSDWMSEYADYAVTPDLRAAFPVMTARVPARDFTRTGVPVSGWEWGDHVGAMVWNRLISFETTSEPWDSARPKYSKYHDPINSLGYRENRYFYPAGVQLSGDAVPPDGTYVPIYSPPGVERVGQDSANAQTSDWAQGAEESVSNPPDTTANEPDEGTE